MTRSGGFPAPSVRRTAAGEAGAPGGGAAGSTGSGRRGAGPTGRRLAPWGLTGLLDEVRFETCTFHIFKLGLQRPFYELQTATPSELCLRARRRRDAVGTVGTWFPASRVPPGSSASSPHRASAFPFVFCQVQPWKCLHLTHEF